MKRRKAFLNLVLLLVSTIVIVFLMLLLGGYINRDGTVEVFTKWLMDNIMVLNFVLSVVLVLLIGLFNYKYIKLEIAKFNLKKVKYVVIITLVYFIIESIYLVVITNFVDVRSENQILIEQEFLKSPLITVMSAVLLAPILEEFIFRVSLYHVVVGKNTSKTVLRYCGVMLTTVLFALLHLDFSADSNLLLISLPYLGGSCLFMYIYLKYNESFGLCTLSHVLTNFIATVMFFVTY